MIPYIIAGAIGYGIAKLVEKDTKKYAEGGGVGSEMYMLLYDFVDEKMIEGDSVAESMINEKGYSLTYDELYNYVDEKMIEGDSDAKNLLNRINSFKNGGEAGKKFAKGGMFGGSAKLEYIGDAYASDEMVDKLRKKLKIKGDSLANKDVISFAYTDYGGDFLDKVAIAYFSEKYPENTIKENSGYGGENAFVFGEPAKEWIETTENYPLGFQDIEDFYYEKVSEQEEKDFNYFLDAISSEYSFARNGVMKYLKETKGGYGNMTTQGLDFSWEDLTDELVMEDLIEKIDEDDEDEYAEGGLVVKNNSDLEEVAKHFTNAVKKHRWDLKDLIHYFEKDNNFDYKKRVKIWEDMNGYEMPKTYNNIYEMLKRISEANGSKYFGTLDNDNEYSRGGGVGNPSRKKMLDYLNTFFEIYSELRTIAIEEDNILTRKMLNSLDNQQLEIAYNDALDYDYKTFDEKGIMADGYIILRTFNGIGMSKDKTYNVIKDDRDSDGKPYYTLMEKETGKVFAQGDSFEEINHYANLFSGKNIDYARGGVSGKDNRAKKVADGGEAGGGRIDKMDKFISELAKKNTKEFSVNEYHDFRNKKYAIGVARHYFTDNDGSFSKFDTKLGDALNIDFETQGDSTFITLGIDDLPQKYGVSEKWLDGKLKLINKPINNKTRNKLLSQLQERFMDDWENNLIGFAPNKKSIVWLEYDYDAQTGLEELSKDGDYVAKKGSKYEEFDNDIWDEYFSSIADDEDEE